MSKSCHGIVTLSERETSFKIRGEILAKEELLFLLFILILNQEGTSFEISEEENARVHQTEKIKD